MQLPPAGTVRPDTQVPPWFENVPLAVPTTVMVGAAVSVKAPPAPAVMVTVPFLTVVFAGELVNPLPASAAVVTVAVPVREVVCVVAPVAATLRLALFAPAVVAPGAKLTLIVQLPPKATVAGSVPQVLVCVNSAGLVPVNPMAVTVSGPTPVLVSVTGCDGLTVRVG